MTGGHGHVLRFDPQRCVSCVACSKACPSRAIRVRDGVQVDPLLCIDCGWCKRACPHGAVSVETSTSADLARFAWKVAIPSTTLYAQFGPEVGPGRILRALTRVGFDAAHDMSWMCEMVGRAADTYLSECEGPWPKISVTCPAVVRLIQIRYPELLPHLLPLETPRELLAKWLRRKIARERSLRPEEIGIFFISPCSAIVQSIARPEGMDASHLDGAFSAAALHGPIRKALEAEDVPAEGISVRGLQWALSGGETAMMRDGSTLAVSGTGDLMYVLDRIESGRFRDVDFLEAYVCPDGCISGPLLVEGRYAARRTLHKVTASLGPAGPLPEERVRALFREHFFDLEGEIRARSAPAPVLDLAGRAERRRRRREVLQLLPRKDCGACGAPDCDTLARDVVDGRAQPGDCVFLKLDRALEAARRP